MDRERLFRRLFSGTLWQGAGLIVANLASFATKLLLARLLVPEYFGLVGMAVVFTGLIQTIEKLGIEQALVQRPDDNFDDDDLITGHWGAILTGALLYLLIVLPGAPLVARFYEEPALTAIIIVLALPILIEPWAVIHKIRLKRRLKFKHLAKVEMVATVLGAIFAIALALLGAGVWALVAQWIVFATATTLILYAIEPAIPSGRFSLDAWRAILRFGAYVTGHRICSFLSKQSDYLIVGKLVGATTLGAYTIAFLLTEAIRSKLMAVLSRVLFPAYSRLQGDLPALNRYYLGSIRLQTLVVAPILCALLICSEPILLYAFGEEWLPASRALQLLAIAALIHTIGGTNSSALKAIDRPDLSFKVRLFETFVVMIPALLLLVPAYGIEGAGLAVIAAKTTSRLAYHWQMRTHIGTTEPQVFKAILPALSSTLVMALSLIWLMHQFPPQSLLQTLLIICLGGILYLLAALPQVYREGIQIWHRLR